MNRIADILEVFYPNGLNAADYRGAIDKAMELLGRWERKSPVPKGEAPLVGVVPDAVVAAEVLPMGASGATAEVRGPVARFRHVPGTPTNYATILDTLKSGPKSVKDIAKVIRTTGVACKVAGAELAQGVKRGDLVRVSPGVYALVPSAEPERPTDAVETVPAAQKARTPHREPKTVPNVNGHAIDRYRIHHPDATREDVLDAFRSGIQIDAGVSASLVGRNWTSKGSRYVLASDFRGLFVSTTSCAPERIVTYLRFEAQQEAFARKHYAAEMAAINGVPQ